MSIRRILLCALLFPLISVAEVKLTELVGNKVRVEIDRKLFTEYR